MKLRLTLPSLKYHKDFTRALRAEVTLGDLSKEKYQKLNKLQGKEYLTMTRERRLGKNLSKGHVAQTEYWLVDGKNYYGEVHIRSRLTLALRRMGGNIGYVIAPRFRGKGYGKVILRMVLLKAKKLGLKKVLITCDKSNVPSRKIIEVNGGEFYREVAVVGHRDRVLQFWIELIKIKK